MIVTYIYMLTVVTAEVRDQKAASGLHSTDRKSVV